MTKKRRVQDADAWRRKQPHWKDGTEERACAKWGGVLKSGIDPVEKRNRHNTNRRALNTEDGVTPAEELRLRLREQLKTKMASLGLSSLKEAALAVGIPIEYFERVFYTKRKVPPRALQEICSRLEIEPEQEDK